MGFVFIVNEQAGRGKCKKRWTFFYNAVRDSLDAHEVYITSKPGEAEDLARKHAKQKVSPTLIAVGGDGTANEILNGVAGSEVKIGLLPFGTGNDLAKALGISPNLKDLINQYKTNSFIYTPINIGKMNGRLFASSAGVGFDGLVADDVNHHPFLKKLGRMGYLLSALKLAKGFTPMHFIVNVDEECHPFSHAWLLAIGNGPYYGGGMKICPGAKMTDDRLDFCVVHNLSKSRFFQLFPSVYKGTHIKETNSVRLFQGKTIEIQATSEQIAHADGEFIVSKSLKIALCDFKQTYLN